MLIHRASLLKTSNKIATIKFGQAPMNLKKKTKKTGPRGLKMREVTELNRLVPCTRTAAECLDIDEMLDDRYIDSSNFMSAFCNMLSFHLFQRPSLVYYTQVSGLVEPSSLVTAVLTSS